MYLNIALIVVGLIVLAVVFVLALAAAKPGTFRVQRKTAIKAPPDRIFPLIDDFHYWTSWSPWEKLDAGMKKTHSGPTSGLGAVYEWEGNKKVGQGRMEILESSVPSKITIKLDFFKPFEAHNVAEFTLTPEGDATRVTWAMIGQQPFMFKVMTLFFSMDKMIGKDFEAGLASMKAIAEG